MISLRLVRHGAGIGAIALALGSSGPGYSVDTSFPPADTVSTTQLVSLKPTNIFEPIKGVVSPDGRFLVYERVEGSNRQLWLRDLSTGSTKALTTTKGLRYAPAWSADSRRIVYSGEVLYQVSGETLEGLWLVDVQGGAERLVYQDSPINGAVVSNPSWTPDGRILFQAYVIGVVPATEGDAGPNTDLWRVGIDGRNAKRVTQGSVSQSLGMTSPDGERIAFVSEGCDGTGQGLWLMKEDGSQSTCLVSVMAPVRSPLWSPDGSKLYVTALSVGKESAPSDSLASLFLVRTGDGASSRLRAPDGEIVEASVLADGRVIAAVYRPTPRIGTLPVSGGRPVPVSTGELPALRPTWRPDGRVLGFTRGSWQRTNWQSGWEAATVPIDHGRSAGPAKTLADVPSGGTDAAWSPDGRILAFARAAQTVYRAKRVNAARLLTLANCDQSTAYPPAWTPSGDSLVLPGGEYGNFNKTDHFHDLGAGKNGLVMVTAVAASLDDTTRWNAPIQALTLDGFDGIAAAPSVSPDGRWIAFTERWQQENPGVYIVPVVGGRVQKVADAGPGEPFSGPEWTADSRWLVFARADGSGGFQLFRVPRQGGPLESVTPPDVDVLHPRRSPDGQTLAVTLWSAPTEFRVISADRAEAARAPVRPPPVKLPATLSGSDVAPELLAFAELVDRVADTVAKAWPGAWSPGQSFVLFAPRVGQTLIVAPNVPTAGVVPVGPTGLPVRLQGRTFLLRDARMERGALGLPFVTLDSFPSQPDSRRAAEERLLAGLYYLRLTGYEDRKLLNGEDDWSPGLPNSPLEGTALARSFSHEPSGYGCPLGDAPSCAAMVMLEQRILRDALEGPDDATRSRLRDYVAVRWLRMLGDFNARRGEIPTERAHGAAGYVARRAALLATGASIAGYRAELDRVLSATTGDEKPPAEVPRIRAAAEATALLLDRLDVAWRPIRRDNASLFDVLSSAVGFDSTMAVPTAIRLMKDYDYPKLVESARNRAPSAEKPPSFLTPAYHLHRYFGRALEALDDSAGVRPLVVTLISGRDRADSLKVLVDIEPGRAGKISTGPGYALYPTARRVRVLVEGLTIDLRDCPVAIDPKAHNVVGVKEITLYPPRQFRERIHEQQPPWPGTPKQLAALPTQVVQENDGLFRAESSVTIKRAINGLFVDPRIYWLTPSYHRAHPTAH